MDYALIKEIIGFVEEYQAGHASNKIQDFTIWLNNRLFSSGPGNAHHAHDELAIAFKLMYLNKKLKNQTKSILLESNVSSIDEYSFLLHLNVQESFRKMEIIEMHNLKAPTGIEIIKRLLSKNLVEEFADREDRRAKRIRITRKGMDKLRKMKPEIDRVFRRVTQPLNLDEKIQMSGILDKLVAGED